MTEGNGDFERGTYYSEKNCPTVNGKVVLDTTENLHGAGPHVRVAEWDTADEQYYAYWMKKSYLHDEINLGICEETGEYSEAELQEIQAELRPNSGLEAVTA